MFKAIRNAVGFIVDVVDVRERKSTDLREKDKVKSILIVILGASASIGIPLLIIKLIVKIMN
ncbi:hypothetical protein [Fonticella tunisiensis]|uniref:Uncharacterized protein n=1 Tax=Fonticella tunisiensis TaxID=1096341 RepID=A0A4V3ETA2_9CLOT|nr:hypothetical protein [Fonticella tunisiensis]TDT58388.1 hypothetical protein EDD71_11122 [Fonticella tunisiensis]